MILLVRSSNRYITRLMLQVSKWEGGGRCISSPAITESKASSSWLAIPRRIYLCHASRISAGVPMRRMVPPDMKRDAYIGPLPKRIGSLERWSCLRGPARKEFPAGALRHRINCIGGLVQEYKVRIRQSAPASVSILRRPPPIVATNLSATGSR